MLQTLSCWHRSVGLGFLSIYFVWDFFDCRGCFGPLLLLARSGNSVQSGGQQYNTRSQKIEMGLELHSLFMCAWEVCAILGQAALWSVTHTSRGSNDPHAGCQGWHIYLTPCDRFSTVLSWQTHCLDQMFQHQRVRQGASNCLSCKYK